MFLLSCVLNLFILIKLFRFSAMKYTRTTFKETSKRLHTFAIRITVNKYTYIQESFLVIYLVKFHHDMVASKHFGYQMLKDLLEIWLGYS